MSLNIKSDEVHELARRLALVSDTSMTSAVEDALRRRLAEVETSHRRRRARAVLEEIWAGMTDDDREALRRAEDEMYDEAGLPR